MGKTSSGLIFAARPRILIKYLAQLLLVLAVLSLVPMTVALYKNDLEAARRYAYLLIPLALIGLGFGRIRAPQQVQGNEAMVLVALIFLLGPLLMSYPLMSSGLSFTDALFEAISGATTTGLSTMPSLAKAPESFLFSRAWMQWYGGLGIVVLILAWVVAPGITARGLATPEADPNDLVGNTRAFARRIIYVYGSITCLGILVLYFLGAGFFNSVLYTFAAVSTGGFSPHDQSLAGLTGMLLPVAVIFLCLLGAIPLNLYYTLVKRKPGLLDLQQVIGFLFIGSIVSVGLGYLISHQYNYEWDKSLFHGFINGFSAQTTAGFNSLPLGEIDPRSKVLIIISMFMGGGVGSTAGGIKILRVLILFSSLRYLILKLSMPPHAVIKPKIAGKELTTNELTNVFGLLGLFVLVVLLSWLAFVLAGYPVLDSLFEVVSATGTVGLSVGITSIELPAYLKGFLCADMLLGRLEIVAWVILFYPRTWLGHRRE